MRDEHLTGKMSMKKFIKEYGVEIIAVLVLFLGLFLIFERMQIRKSLLGFIRTTWESILIFISSVWGWIETIKTVITISDLIGILLLISVIIFGLWRIRYRFDHTKKWLAVTCPKCGSAIIRIHRSPIDKITGAIFFPNARKYGCTNENCDWRGLRRKGRRREYKQQLEEFIESD